MRRFTTTKLTIEIGLDLTEAEVYVTFTQFGEPVLEKKDSDLEKTEDGFVSLPLEQDETALFEPGFAELQLAYGLGDFVDRSTEVTFYIDDVLKAEEI